MNIFCLQCRNTLALCLDLKRNAPYQQKLKYIDFMNKILRKYSRLKLFYYLILSDVSHFQLRTATFDLYPVFMVIEHSLVG